jgi:transposase
LQSGTSVHRKDRISKRGTPRVRNALDQAAGWALRCCAPFRPFYQGLLDRQQPKKVALVAVARKILRVILALVKQGTTFDPASRARDRSDKIERIVLFS